MAFFLPFLIGSGAVWAVNKISGAIAKSNKIANSNNPPTNTDAQQKELLKPINDRLDNLDKDIIDKVNKHLEDKLGDNQLTPREKKEQLEKIKSMSKEEKAELLNQLKSENSAEQEAINKTLKEKLDKQDKRNIQLAKELQEAKNNNDPAQIAKVAQMMKDNDKNQQATRLALKKNEAEARKQTQLIDQYFQSVEQDKPWFLDMNFKSPWLWGILLFSCVIFYFLYKAFMWAWGKVKEMFVSG